MTNAPCARRRKGAVTVLVAAMTGFAGQSAVAQALTPHRAVYDLSLARADASVNMLSAKGRLVYEISGAPCEGFTVNSRFVTRTVDREGSTQLNDLRSATFETFEPGAEFNFVNQTLVGDEVASVLDGTATAKASGTIVAITQPKTSAVELPRAVFPTQHTFLLLEAAADGDRVIEAPVFDGGGNADEVFNTTSLIGSGETGLPEASERERAVFAALPDADGMSVHKLVISYFSQDSTGGEGVPEYVISFQMLNNGISYDATFDYGGFTLTGRLAELELGPASDCGPSDAGSPATGAPQGAN